VSSKLPGQTFTLSSLTLGNEFSPYFPETTLDWPAYTASMAAFASSGWFGEMVPLNGEASGGTRSSPSPSLAPARSKPLGREACRRRGLAIHSGQTGFASRLNLGVRPSMKDILTQLTSPEWWFTVVFIGLFVSVLGNYARDWIGRSLSKLSGGLAAKIRILRVRRRLRARFLSRNTDLLQVDYTRSIIDLLLAAFAFALSFVLPAWDTLIQHYPQADFLVSAVGVPQFPRWAQITLYASLLIQGIFLWNKFLRKFSTCERASCMLTKRRSNSTFKPFPPRRSA